MRAAVLSHFGGPEVIRVVDNLPLPRCQPHEVLVRVAAAAVNPLDCRIRGGYGRALFEPLLPMVLGRDVSGEVVAAGSGARAFPVGTHVFGALSPVAVNGTHAEYVAVPEAHVAKKPNCLTHEEASAIPFAALTAWRALFATGELKEGERVLIMGGGSAVGTAAAQLALAKGCHVAATCGPRSRARLASLGVDQVADYTASGRDGSVGAVARSEGWAPFDVALDTVGSRKSERGAMGLLRKGVGRYVTLHGQLAGLMGEQGIVAGRVLYSRMRLLCSQRSTRLSTRLHVRDVTVCPQGMHHSAFMADSCIWQPKKYMCQMCTIFYLHPPAYSTRPLTVLQYVL